MRDLDKIPRAKLPQRVAQLVDKPPSLATSPVILENLRKVWAAGITVVSTLLVIVGLTTGGVIAENPAVLSGDTCARTSVTFSPNDTAPVGAVNVIEERTACAGVRFTDVPEICRHA